MNDAVYNQLESIQELEESLRNDETKLLPTTKHKILEKKGSNRMRPYIFYWKKKEAKATILIMIVYVIVMRKKGAKRTVTN